MNPNENPLLDEWRRIAGSAVGPGDNWWDARPPFPLADEGDDDPYRARRRLANMYAWSVPSDDALDEIARRGPVVDVMAGTGYWARLLADRGVDIIAYDIAPPDAPLVGVENPWHTLGVAWFDIARADCSEAAAKHPDRTLLLSWPPHGEDHGWRALKAYTRAGGRTVVHIGESNGCTGDDRLQGVLLDGRFGVWSEVESLPLPQWPGMHDWLTVHERAA